MQIEAFLKILSAICFFVLRENKLIIEHSRSAHRKILHCFHFSMKLEIRHYSGTSSQGP